MTESEYLQHTIQDLRSSLAKIPAKYAEGKRRTQNQIDALCEKAGILTEIDSLKDSLENLQRDLQSQADSLQGQIRALDLVFQQFHMAPVPEDQPIMYGIDLASLDPETRIMVMHGQDNPTWRETIETLGGDPDFREWDGTYEEDEEDEPQVAEEAEEDDAEEDFDSRSLSSERLMDLWHKEMEDEGPPPAEAEDLEHEEEEDDDPLFAELERLEQKVEEGRGTKEDLTYLTELSRQLTDGS